MMSKIGCVGSTRAQRAPHLGDERERIAVASAARRSGNRSSACVTGRYSVGKLRPIEPVVDDVAADADDDHPRLLADADAGADRAAVGPELRAIDWLTTATGVVPV